MGVQSWFYQRVSKHLAHPGPGLLGWYTMRRMENVNKHLAVNCVRLLDIQPDDKVLEVGFGPGIGLRTAYQYVKDGSGIIYGIDPSIRSCNHASKRLKKELKEEKILVYPVRLPLVPFKKDFFDKIYHTNCYYFWWNMSAACTELYNILAPHGKMVTTLNIDRLKWIKSKGGFRVGDYDPLRYMAALEEAGFENIHIQYLMDETDKQFKEYQAIFAEVGAKNDALSRNTDSVLQPNTDFESADISDTNVEDVQRVVLRKERTQEKRAQSVVK